MISFNENGKGRLPLVDWAGNEDFQWSISQNNGNRKLRIESEGSPFAGVYDLVFYMDSSKKSQGVELLNRNLYINCSKFLSGFEFTK
jgi:hypothetical protein